MKPLSVYPVIDLQGQKKLSSFKNACFCDNKEKVKDVFFMCKCNNMAHMSCMPWRYNEFGEFECTACTILSNDPLNEVLEVLLEPSILQSSFIYNFKLRAQDFNTLNEESNLDIEIRCIKMDGEHFFEQTWPDKADIKINGEMVRQVLPLVYNSSLKKRRDEKLIVKKPVVGKNTISLNFENVKDGKNTKIDKDPAYTIAVVLVRKLKINELAEKIIKNNTIPKSDTVKLIKDKFQGSRDVRISEVKADIECKISLTPIVHPARGKNCTHLNCFSLKYFLKSMQFNPCRNWVCPLCRRPCTKLVVDSYIETIVADMKNNDPDRKEVFFRKDGSVCNSLDRDIQSEIFSTGGSSKTGNKQMSSKMNDKMLDSHIIMVEDDASNFEFSILPKTKGNSENISNLFIDEKTTINLSDDNNLGKRIFDSEKSFVDDKEFISYLHNYTKKAKLESIDINAESKNQTSYSSFEHNFKKRITNDVVAKHLFQVFYTLVMKKKKEKESFKQKSPIKNLYNEMLSEIRFIDNADKHATSSIDENLDVLQWMLKEYRVDFENLPYRHERQASDFDNRSLL